MSDMNSVSLMGRLTADPELKTTQNGISYCRFTLAANRYSKDGEDTADFISCVAWRSTAEFICNYFLKGNKIALIGSIQTGSYTDKDGRKVYTTDVNTDKVFFCESKKESSSESNTKSSKSRTPRKEPIDDEVFEEIADDLPF
jgi:single-strand DNA-binding protein